VCHLHVSTLSVGFIISMKKYVLSCTASLDICYPPADSFFQTAFPDKWEKQRIPHRTYQVMLEEIML